MLRYLVALFACAGLVACGGNVVVDHGSGNGAGGAGGSVSTPGASGSVTSSSQTSSSTGDTSTIASTGSGTSCPDDPHEDGHCEMEGQTCPMPHACCAGQAVCKGGQWHFTGALCNSLCGTVCGPDDQFACAPDAVCVVDQRDLATDYHCAANRCPGNDGDCSCAQSICEVDHLSCGDVKFPFVLCDCPNC